MSKPTKNNKPARLSIQIPGDLEEIYANLALISHSTSEIIVDFARMMPNKPNAKVHARVIMTPMNAKLLYRALAENLQKFEAKYGEIQIPAQNIVLDREQGFKS